MFNKLGGAITRHPVSFLVGWLLVVALAAGGALWGFGEGSLFGRMTSSDSMVEGSESDQVSDLTSAKDQGASIIMAVEGVDLATQFADLAGFMAQHRATIQDVADVASVADPFLFPDPMSTPEAQAMLSTKGDGFVMVVTLVPGLEGKALDSANAAVGDAVKDFQAALRQVAPDAAVHELSDKLVGDAINKMVQSDLVRGEGIGLPVALLLLIIVFGGLLAAGMPLIGAGASIVTGMGVLWLLTFTIGIDSFILNVISIIGLALSIDYGLLVVSRFREELATALTDAGLPPDGSELPDKAGVKELVAKAIRATVATAGRTVSFSALTIACAICGMFVFESAILRTVAAGGVIVTVLAVSTAVTLVPAIIVLLGGFMARPSVLTKVPGLRTATRAVGDASSDTGVFSRLAHWVHAHPWPIIVGVGAILVLMASPIRGLSARSAFDEYLPADADVTSAYNLIQEDYPALQSASLIVVADAPADQATGLYGYLAQLPGVDFITPAQPLPGDATRSYINVHIAVADQVGDEMTDIMLDVRDYDAGFSIRVGGPAALQHDFVESILDRAPLALAIILLAVLVLLFLMTGSVIIPIKALIINSLSLVASLGTTVWIFDHGYFGMPKVLGLETFIITCCVCFGFGLAMDYEVFLLARIKEEWDAGHTNDEAVEKGLQRSGRIITSAAAIIIAVFVGFTFGEMVAIKEVGVALTITVLADATLVRMLLVPATMTILGKWNWWAPKPLVTLYEKFKLVH
jgi:RND superfamily putative drug exporter